MVLLWQPQRGVEVTDNLTSRTSSKNKVSLTCKYVSNQL